MGAAISRRIGCSVNHFLVMLGDVQTCGLVESILSVYRLLEGNEEPGLIQSNSVFGVYGELLAFSPKEPHSMSLYYEASSYEVHYIKLMTRLEGKNLDRNHRLRSAVSQHSFDGG